MSFHICLAIDKSAALTDTTTPSDCQTLSYQSPGDRPDQQIDGYERQDFEKRKIIRREWKTT